MAMNLVSAAERVFILDGAEAGFRTDGRGPADHRPIRVETGLVSGAHGSARVRLGPNDVVAAVKASLRPLTGSSSSEGGLSFGAEVSAVCGAEWEGRAGEELADALAGLLRTAYADPRAFRRAQLLVHSSVDKETPTDNGQAGGSSSSPGPVGAERGRMGWELSVDGGVVEGGRGGLVDAVSMAVKAALSAVRLPALDLVRDEEAQGWQAEVAEERPLSRLDLAGQAPLLLQVAKLRSANVLDPSMEEEAVSSASLVVGVLPGEESPFTLVQKTGPGALDPDSIQEMMTLGRQGAARLHRALQEKLTQEEQREETPLGFLAH